MAKREEIESGLKMLLPRESDLDLRASIRYILIQYASSWLTLHSTMFATRAGNSGGLIWPDRV